MTTYVYETITHKRGQKARYYEIKQAMDAEPITRHPETGEPIRRVVLGGFGTLSSKRSANSGSACGCKPGTCCG